MDRLQYIKRVMPIVSELGEEKADMIMDKIAEYLVNAGEENEAAALNALGIPELFARKFLHTNGDYEIPPFVASAPKKNKAQESRSADNPAFSEAAADIKQPVEEKKPAVDERPAVKPERTVVNNNMSAASAPAQPVQKEKPRYDSKRMWIVLGLLVITSPIWLCFMALFCLIALAFAFAVAAILLAMSVGGVCLTVFGVMRLFSILPVGLVMAGGGLILLGISGVAFIPLLKSSVTLFCDTFKDIYVFVRRIISIAFDGKTEA